jgi:hypothetical protein
METLLLLIGIIIAALVFIRPAAPRPQIIYVPVEVVEPRGSGLGCLPLLIVGVLALLALGVIGI